LEQVENTKPFKLAYLYKERFNNKSRFLAVTFVSIFHFEPAFLRSADRINHLYMYLNIRSGGFYEKALN